MQSKQTSHIIATDAHSPRMRTDTWRTADTETTIVSHSVQQLETEGLSCREREERKKEQRLEAERLIAPP